MYIQVEPEKYSAKIVNHRIISYKIIHKLNINEEHVKSLEEMEDKMCLICLENKITLQTNCNHNYCTNCITEHYKINHNCPYCRSKIQECYKIV